MKIEDVIFLCCRHYSRKNKTTALKLILSRISPSNLLYPSEYIEALEKLSDEPEFRKMII